MNSRSVRDGFSLIEILVVIGILGVLGGLIVLTYPRIYQSASKAKCMSNMRVLHVGFANYVQENNIWPQLPENESDPFDPKVEDLWIKTMSPYVQNESAWQCPILKAARITGPSGNILRMHYVPTRFDANPISPRRWSTQPWLVEIADAHGDGALITFPDGSIHSMGEVIRNFQRPPAGEN